ncbi:MAG: LolA-related protein [Pseudomonadota bacterium]
MSGPSAAGSAASVPAGWQTLAALEFAVGERLPFEETTVSRILKRPVTATGELWLAADGTLIMAIEAPRFERRALEQRFVTLTRLRSGADRNPDDPADLIVRRLPIQADRPAQVLLRSIAQLLDGNIDALQDSFELLAPQEPAPPGDTGASWELRLEPRAERLRRRLPMVVLKGTGDRLLAVRADRGTQGSQTVRLLDTAASS